MNNMASIIKGHNKKVLNNEKASSAGCNCRNKNNCPLDNQCLTTATIYQAKVFEPGKDDDPKVYVGMAESESLYKNLYIVCITMVFF